MLAFGVSHRTNSPNNLAPPAPERNPFSSPHTTQICGTQQENSYTKLWKTGAPKIEEVWVKSPAPRGRAGERAHPLAAVPGGKRKRRRSGSGCARAAPRFDAGGLAPGGRPGYQLPDAVDGSRCRRDGRRGHRPHFPVFPCQGLEIALNSALGCRYTNDLDSGGARVRRNCRAEGLT